MKINEVDIFVVRIPFKETFRHALAERNEAHNVIVRVRTQEGVEGFGECVPREYVTGETIPSVVQAIQNAWAPSLWKWVWQAPADILPFLAEWERRVFRDFALREDQALASRCAVELAFLDAAGKSFGVGAGALLGWDSPAKEVFYSGVISGAALASVICKALLMRLYGFRAVKLKVGAPQDREKVKWVRRCLGEKVDLRVDANGAWETEEALRKIAELETQGVSAVEQPVSKENKLGMIRVTAAANSDIVADESLCSVNDALWLAEQKGCDIFNIRISKCGGLFLSEKIYQIARRFGLQAQLGCQVGETAILSSAGRVFAQSHPDLRFAEGSYEKHLLKEDLSKNRVCFYYKGRGQPLLSPGLGVQIVPDRLNRAAVSKITLKHE